MMRKLSPAEYVIDQLNGVNKTAQALDLWPGAVSKWKSIHKPFSKRLVPARHHKKILELAKERNLDIKAEHLIG